MLTMLTLSFQTHDKEKSLGPKFCLEKCYEDL